MVEKLILLLKGYRFFMFPSFLRFLFEFSILSDY